jgi:hypothetical protein
MTKPNFPPFSQTATPEFDILNPFFIPQARQTQMRVISPDLPPIKTASNFVSL